MYIMLNSPEHLKDMLKRLDSCMSKNFWPISLIPSLPWRCANSVDLHPLILHTISRSTRHAGIKKPATVTGSSRRFLAQWVLPWSAAFSDWCSAALTTAINALIPGSTSGDNMRIVDLAFLPNLVKNRRITERDFNQRAQHPFGHFHFTRHNSPASRSLWYWQYTGKSDGQSSNRGKTVAS